jgi:hypothetical protein
MRRQDLDDGAGRWTCLRLTVERPGLPGLRVEVASGGRLALTQDGAGARLFGWRRPRWQGVDWTRSALAETYVSPLGPLSAERARKIGQAPADAAARWAHLFAGRLDRSRGPLHSGTWIVAPGNWPAHGAADRSAHWHTAVHTDHPNGFIDWRPTAAQEQILPLRPLSSTDAGRVKALRKLAREGCLPPVLLWWISGLNCLVVLDGHDRIVAAHAEDIAPPVLELGLAAPDQQKRGALDYAESRYTQRMAEADKRAADGDPLARYAIATASRDLAGDLRQIAATFGPTRAWPLRGGAVEWTAQLRAHAPGWLTHVHAKRETQVLVPGPAAARDIAPKVEQHLSAQEEPVALPACAADQGEVD